MRNELKYRLQQHLLHAIITMHAIIIITIYIYMHITMHNIITMHATHYKKHFEEPIAVSRSVQ